MKGERLYYNELLYIKDDTKLWIEDKYHSSDLYIVINRGYGFTFVTDMVSKKWESIFMDDSTLEYSIKNNIIKIYKWISDKEYIENKIFNLKDDINFALEMKDKKTFNKLSMEYNNLLKEKDKIFEINKNKC